MDEINFLHVLILCAVFFALGFVSDWLGKAGKSLRGRLFKKDAS